MKTQAILISTILLMFSTTVSLTAQIPLTEIEGRLSIHLPSDTTTIHIGKNAGSNQDLLSNRFNTVIGTDAGRTGSDLLYNTFIGYKAAEMAPQGSFSTFVGIFAGHANSGSNNNFFGANAGSINVGDYNNFYGTEAGIFNQSGTRNSFFGHQSGQNNVDGSDNSFYGYLAGKEVTGGKNIIIGSLSGPTPPSADISERLFIDVETSDTPLIYGEFDNDIVRVHGRLDTENGTIFMRNLGDFDTDRGIKWGESNNLPAFGFIYDGLGTGDNNRLHLREYIDNTESDLLTIKADGNVGIGTNDPEARLHIGSNSGSGDILFENEGVLQWKTSSGIHKEILKVAIDDNTALNAEEDIIFHSGGSTGPLFRAMTIKADNKIGVGTTNPLWLSVIKETANAITGGATIDISNLATVFAKESNTNNEGIGIGFQSSSDEENVGAAIVHERTGSSSQGKLHFGSKTTTGFADDIQVNMTISDDGNVGIGTVTPVHKLDVAGTTRSIDIICGATTLCSDARYKKAFESIKNPISTIQALNGYFHFWKSEEFPEWQFANDRQIGFKAQEVREVLPELVTEMSDGYLGVEYSKLAPVLVEAIKEQQHVIEYLKGQLEKRNKQMDQILERLEQLEKVHAPEKE